MMDRAAVYIDRDVHKEAKIKCATLGITLTEYLNKLIRNDVRVQKENE